MSVREAPPGAFVLPDLRMSYEEYLAWAGEDAISEWVDGEVITFMPAKDIHQSTSGFLYQLIRLFIELFHLGQVRYAPFEMRLRKMRSSREPDILFVSQANLSKLTPERLDGAADLVIEIVSDDSVQRDRRDKYLEYAAAGVKEYWVIDPRPQKHRADFFILNEQSQYELFATEDDAKVSSQVLTGFWLRPDWLWQAGTLDPFLAFCEIRGFSPEQAQQIQEMLRRGPDNAVNASAE